MPYLDGIPAVQPDGPPEGTLTATGKIQKLAIRDSVTRWRSEGDERFASADVRSRGSVRLSALRART